MYAFLFIFFLFLFLFYFIFFIFIYFILYIFFTIYILIIGTKIAPELPLSHSFCRYWCCSVLVMLFAGGCKCLFIHLVLDCVPYEIALIFAHIRFINWSTLFIFRRRSFIFRCFLSRFPDLLDFDFIFSRLSATILSVKRKKRQRLLRKVAYGAQLQQHRIAAQDNRWGQCACRISKVWDATCQST